MFYLVEYRITHSEGVNMIQRPRVNMSFSPEVLEGAQVVQRQTGLPLSRVVDYLLLYHMKGGEADPVATLVHDLMRQIPGPTPDQIAAD